MHNIYYASPLSKAVLTSWVMDSKNRGYTRYSMGPRSTFAIGRNEMRANP